MRFQSAIRATALRLPVLILLLLGCQNDRSHSGHSLIIAVVGDGVPSDVMCESRDTPLNRAQGRAMWDGADAAYRLSPEIDRKEDFFEIVGYDDCGKADSAIRIARQLRDDPNVVAVIGHAASGTTRVAAPIYAEAGIPLIMPIATSPYAVIPPGNTLVSENRLQNCLRLPPSDDKAQAPAVSYLAEQKLKGNRFWLFRDTTADAKEYSEPMYNAIRVHLGTKVRKHFSVSRDDPRYTDLLLSLKQDSINAIIFVGYGTTAQDFLSALRSAKEISFGDSPFPKVVLTDGCMIDDLDISGLEVYLTFPLPDVTRFERESDDYRALLNLIKQKGGRQSYEMFGYDAMLILASAIETCGSQQITRDCVRRYINDLEDFKGACLGYQFQRGENSGARYYVFASDSIAQGNPKLSLKWDLLPEDYNYYTAKR